MLDLLWRGWDPGGRLVGLTTRLAAARSSPRGGLVARGGPRNVLVRNTDDGSEALIPFGRPFRWL
jgi:hypothetical protein